jgi:hypothetical protein
LTSVTLEVQRESLMKYTILLITLLLAACSVPPAPPENWEGRWDRTDGTYRLEVEVDAQGHPSARYFNPGPIHVESATFKDSPEGRHLVIILNDRGYPGAIYDLQLDSQNEQLEGSYYNPRAGHPFPVAFRRDAGP